jgi:hypothetical protein
VFDSSTSLVGITKILLIYLQRILSVLLVICNCNNLSIFKEVFIYSFPFSYFNNCLIIPNSFCNFLTSISEEFYLFVIFVNSLLYLFNSSYKFCFSSFDLISLLSSKLILPFNVLILSLRVYNT